MRWLAEDLRLGDRIVIAETPTGHKLTNWVVVALRWRAVRLQSLLANGAIGSISWFQREPLEFEAVIRNGKEVSP